MKNYGKVVLTVLVMLFLATGVFALESTLSLRGGLSQSVTDITDDNQIKGMVGLSYEVWMAKWLSLGIYPYYTAAEAGEKTGTDTGYLAPNFKTPLVGGDLMFKVRPTWKKAAPYAIAGVGVVNFFPKYRDGGHIEAFPPEDYDYTVAVLPAVGAGIDIFTKWGIDFELGGQYEFVASDYLDARDRDDDNDAFWMAYLGISHTFGKPKPAPVVVIPQEPETPPPPKPVVIPELKLSPNTRNVSYEAGKTEVIVTCNTDWQAKEDENWLSVSPTSGKGNANFVVNYDENTSSASRTGYIYFTAGEVKETLTIIQAGKTLPPLELKTVYFDFDKYNLRPDAVATLDANLAILANYPNVKLDIQGHTDYIGPEPYNLDLSEERAKSVYNYMVQKGIDPSRLSISYYGESQPIAPNDTKEGRALNRRVEFKVK
ncbi:MAG TPA: OmpA family protein [Candidatus Cloacimonadota bacterium]|nr:OmpA family protein [Candidatus Cloacimonadota bacterium]